MATAKKNPYAFALASKIFQSKVVCVGKKKGYDRRAFKKGE
jgi:hypothetical protein